MDARVVFFSRSSLLGPNDDDARGAGAGGGGEGAGASRSGGFDRGFVGRTRGEPGGLAR